MSFTTMDKRLVERNDLAFQEKYLKDSARHTSDAADKAETDAIEHAPICLYEKKFGNAESVQTLPAESEPQNES